MRAHPFSAWAVATALLAAAWAFFLCHPAGGWSGADSPPWLAALDSQPVYDGIRLWLASMGLHDQYLVFGAAATASFLLLWFATGPTFVALGWSGRVLGWLLLISAVVTFLSYLNHSTDAPLRVLWGAEALALPAICLWAMIVGLVAPRGVARSGSVRARRDAAHRGRRDHPVHVLAGRKPHRPGHPGRGPHCVGASRRRGDPDGHDRRGDVGVTRTSDLSVRSGSMPQGGVRGSS